MMKKLLLIITLCTITSLSMVTPAAAASVTSYVKSTNEIKVCSNTEKQLSQITQCLIGKQLLSQYALKNSDCLKVLNTINLATLNQCNNIVKPSNSVKTKDITIKKVKKVKKAKKCSPKVSKSTTINPSPTTKPSTTTKPSATPTPTPTTKPSPTTKPTTSTDNTTTKPVDNTTTNISGNYREFQKSVIALVNKERAAVGLSALKENTELDNVATLKSEDMAKLGYFSHTSPTYGSPFEMLKQFGISYTAAGENIAYGQSTPAEVMTGWMNSEGHRANILNSNFTQIGVGIAKKANGQYVWTQTFTRP